MQSGKRKTPVNRYPKWKYWLIFIILIGAVIYALPNLFGQAPSLQVSSNQGSMTPAETKKIKQTLAAHDIDHVQIAHPTDAILQMQFNNQSDQQKAKQVLEPQLGHDYTVALSMKNQTPEWLKVIGGSPMNLGLDLQGGLYLALDADTQTAVNAQLDNRLTEVANYLNDQQIDTTQLVKAGQPLPNTLTDAITIPRPYQQNGFVLIQLPAEKMDQAVAALQTMVDDPKQQNHDLIYKRLNDQVLVLSFTQAQIAKIKDQAISQVLTVMRNRINNLGVSEASVSRSGNNRVIIELPGMQDVARAKQILGGTATAQFYLVKPVAPSDRLKVEQQGDKVYQLDSSDARPTQYYQLLGSPVAGGSDIINAVAGYDQRNNQPVVNVELSSTAASHFRDMTSSHIGSPMGVMMVETHYETVTNDQGQTEDKLVKNERLINVATIQSALSSHFQITGLGQRQANNLALMIRSGALQVPVNIAEEQQIGPTLGQENIDKGVLSIIIALLAVVVFMLVYYRLFGLIANVALLFNLILIIAIMSIIPGATLTLPGIAGIVLNLGMAIDSNVLIFERIREELRNGMPVQSAIYSGYERAFATIVDSNLTTLIVGVILFAIGTGAVKGFAVTLIIGILTSLFTSIVVSRALTNLVYGKRKKLKSISIGIKTS